MRVAPDRPLRFDMESLRVFVAIIEEGSIAAAARRTHLVASAVSKRVADLEADSGTPLLYRHSRGVQATPAGNALYHHAKRMIEHVQQISDELSEYSQGLRGHARIYVNFTAMVQYLPDALRSFLRVNPKVGIDMVEKSSDDVVQAIEGGVADLGICSAAPDLLQNLQWRTYSVDRLVLIVPEGHRLSRCGSVRFADALDEDFICMPYGTSIPKLCRAAAEREGPPLRVRIEVTSFEGVRNMVSAGLGVGVLPEGSVLPYAQTSSLRMIRLDDSWALRPLMIVARNFETLPLPARMLVDHLENHDTQAGSRPETTGSEGIQQHLSGERSARAILFFRSTGEATMPIEDFSGFGDPLVSEPAPEVLPRGLAKVAS